MTKLWATITGLFAGGFGVKKLWKYYTIAKKVLAKKSKIEKEGREAWTAGKKAWDQIDDLPREIVMLISIGKDLRTGKIVGDEAVRRAGAQIEVIGKEAQEAATAALAAVKEIKDVFVAIKE